MIKKDTFDKEKFKKELESNVRMLFRRKLEEATPQQIYQAVAYSVKDDIIDNWIETHKAYEKQDKKMVYYMSMEFLMGRALGNNMINLLCYDDVRETLEELGLDLNLIEDQEPDAALGNGGLGRLAACFLDSLATLGYPAYGCGIRYRYGMFKQKIENGYQVEVPDNWLKYGNPFEIKRDEYAVEVKFGGYVDVEMHNGRQKFVQKGYQSVRAVPYDMPIVGYGNHIVNTLRIWDAEAINNFNLDSFDKGEYQKAVEQENLARTICEVLYPNDNHMAGKELRLKQQYFFISASVQRAIAKYKETHDDIRKFHEKVTFQLNDTHPTVAVAELMRILVDEEGLEWDEAWEITRKTCAYTNHTIMAEALEKWPIELFSRLLPRVYQIVEEINRRFCKDMHDIGVDGYKVGRMAPLNDGYVKMANLAVVASHKVNGVAALHSQILKDDVFHDFYTEMPDKFTNVTNGIAHRRWLNQSNPGLANLLNETIGEGYIREASELQKLMAYKDDAAFLKKLAQVKKENKVKFAEYVKKHNNIDIDPDSIFDVQIKRMHEYKRQHLNALNILATYQWLKANPSKTITPRTYIFGAKAAPGYYFAKQMMQFIYKLGEMINNDPSVNKMMKVVYIEDYRVTVAEKLIPAGDISQQISQAGKEASGTGNMKFMINGAVTMGTLDGANVEIHESVGDDNIILFGLTTPEVNKLAAEGYCPQNIVNQNEVIRNALDAMKHGISGTTFENIADNLTTKDPYMVLADFDAYRAAREKAEKLYNDPMKWNSMCAVNIAQAGRFAADRAIREYAENIWNAKPLPHPVEEKKAPAKKTSSTTKTTKTPATKSTTKTAAKTTRTTTAKAAAKTTEAPATTAAATKPAAKTAPTTAKKPTTKK